MILFTLFILLLFDEFFTIIKKSIKHVYKLGIKIHTKLSTPIFFKVTKKSLEICLTKQN